MSAATPNDPIQSATISSSQPTSSPLPNGFMISNDGNSASKKFKIDEKEYVITINFSKDANTDDIKNQILNQFKDEHILVMGKYANQLGLGTKETVTSVEFKKNKEGDLIAVKHRKDSSTTKEYSIEHDKIPHYEKKIKDLEQDKDIKKDLQKSAKLSRAKDKLNSLKQINYIWTTIKSPKKLKKEAEEKEESLKRKTNTKRMPDAQKTDEAKETDEAIQEVDNSKKSHSDDEPYILPNETSPLLEPEQQDPNSNQVEEK